MAAERQQAHKRHQQSQNQHSSSTDGSGQNKRRVDIGRRYRIGLLVDNFRWFVFWCSLRRLLDFGRGRFRTAVSSLDDERSNRLRIDDWPRFVGNDDLWHTIIE